MTSQATHTVAGLFAGVGGIELGLQQRGFESVLLCEIDAGAQAVLRQQFRGVEIAENVEAIDALPSVDVVSAGFPCQDLSQAGGKRGILGRKSAVVRHVFRLLDTARARGALPPVVVFENVSYMLRLAAGGAMEYLVEELERLGYAWAYRVIDARAFGIPQRRQRVVLIASTDFDPATALMGVNAEEPELIDAIGPVDMLASYGFYWTEGKRGLGWARDAVPTLKGGSRIGIPSPPAIWRPVTGEFGLPSLEDAERLQGFSAGYTEPADQIYSRPRRYRWNLVGNAVCVPIAEWVADRIRCPDLGSMPERREFSGRWPMAAAGSSGRRLTFDVSMRPLQRDFVALGDYLTRPLTPLSHRAARGFLSRALSGNLRFAEGFLASLERYTQTSELDRIAA